MAAEKAARRKSGAPRLVIARGVLLALVLWACGAGLLAALMTAGLVGDAGAFPALCGATAFAFAEGASLSVGSAEVEESAAVSVSGANLLRIGTSKCLTRDERSHISVNGFGARQDADGWIVPKPGIIISIH